MKTTNMQAKGRGGGNMKAANPQQVIFELKKKVVTALNKLADRDTHQRGVDELENTVEHLAPDKISCFLSCILDTDSEQKSAVRKECIRLMATLARFHHGLVAPYLAKMVSSVVKRLKDQDSVVRDACIETMGVLASKMSCYEDESYGVFVSLVKPLFEAIGDQNKYVQSGAALCLARVVDSSPEAPVAIIQRMLTKTVKLLNSSHFIAKPAVIELNRSIILAGGATTKSVLISAMSSFQDALKNKDWTTRKAASVALMEIAATGEKFLGPLKASCISSLESCRFDKVKPVRDSIVLALQYWKGVPGSDSQEPSETVSSVRESYSGAQGDSELFSTSDSKSKDVTSNKYVIDLARKKVPFSARNAPTRYNERTKQDNWRIEIAVPESPIVSKVNLHNEESEGSCITKTFAEAANTPEVTYEYIPIEDKAGCYVTDAVNENDDIKSVTVSSNSFLASGMVNPAIRSKEFAAEETYSEEQQFSTKVKNRTSTDSTVTVSSSEISHDCCAQISNEMASVRKQLSDIENKQSRLIDQLQVFSTGIMNNFSALQSKVLSLEYAVEGIAQNFALHSDISNSNFVKLNQGSTVSPRLSSCTSRNSTEIRNRQSTLSSSKYSMTRENKTHGRSKLNVSQGKEKTPRSAFGEAGQQHTREDIWNNVGQGRQTLSQTRKSSESVTKHYAEVMSGPGGSCEDVVEAEYLEVLSGGDELALVELLDRTGPVLDNLSSNTVNELLSILLSYLLERRFMNSILPWLHQVADLSTTNGANYLIPSARKRAQVLSAIQETSCMGFSNLAERRAVTQLAMKLRKLWGKCS
ncbi:TORTIFOLIA1-like protein 2 [Brassica napus]|uniref:TORTIFOLIA1-like protein 2 n=1 Tax=Brassica napus TaxID=3708 RepID=UPI0020788320|nr:TORTIFOLIA1-like protein 2 [Brassica napus]